MGLGGIGTANTSKSGYCQRGHRFTGNLQFPVEHFSTCYIFPCFQSWRSPTFPGVQGPAGVCLRISASHWGRHWPISSLRCEQSTRTP